jgi:hypothetical protein
MQAQDPFRDFNSDETLKAELRGKLFAMASGGMRDPEIMRQTIATLSSKHDAK